MRDKASMIRVPQHKYAERVSVPCDSLDSLNLLGFSLDSVLGEYEDPIEDSFIWSYFARLLSSGVISREDLTLLYYKYMKGCSCNTIAVALNMNRRTVNARIERIIRRVRPYFFGHRKI
jgi:hypothetical protein